MSLVLNRGTKPGGLVVRTHGFKTEPTEIIHGQDVSVDQMVFFGEYRISLEDFLSAAHYVLTNTDLRPGDDELRLAFVTCIKAMTVVSGHNEGGKRLYSPLLPVVRNDEQE